MLESKERMAEVLKSELVFAESQNVILNSQCENLESKVNKNKSITDNFEKQNSKNTQLIEQTLE